MMQVSNGRSNANVFKKPEEPSENTPALPLTLYFDIVPGRPAPFPDLAANGQNCSVIIKLETQPGRFVPSQAGKVPQNTTYRQG